MALSLISLAFNSKHNEALAQFYEALGAKLLPKKVKVGSMTYQGEINGIEISIYHSEHPEPPKLPSVSLRFKVDDIEGTLSRLRAQPLAQVMMDMEMMPDGKKAIVLDPDGRSVEIVELWKSE